jgi:hypothetical protein
LGVVTLFSREPFNKDQFDTLQMLSSAVIAILNSPPDLEEFEQHSPSRTSQVRRRPAVS